MTVRDLLAELTRADAMPGQCRLYARHESDPSALLPVLSVERRGGDIVLVCGSFEDDGRPL